MQPLRDGLGNAGAVGEFQRTETLAELELLFVGQALIAEHQNGVAIHPGCDRCHRFRRQLLSGVDAGDFTSEDRVQWRDLDAHPTLRWVVLASAGLYGQPRACRLLTVMAR